MIAHICCVSLLKSLLFYHPTLSRVAAHAYCKYCIEKYNASKSILKLFLSAYCMDLEKQREHSIPTNLKKLKIKRKDSLKLRRFLICFICFFVIINAVKGIGKIDEGTFT